MLNVPHITADMLNMAGYRVPRYAKDFKVIHVNEEKHEITWEYWYLTWPAEDWDFGEVTVTVDNNGGIISNWNNLFPY